MLNWPETDVPADVCRPEPGGVIAGGVFLICMFVFMPFPFLEKALTNPSEFPHNQARAAVAVTFCSCC